MRSASTQDPLAALEARLREMQTRTLSTLKITGSDNQTYVSIQNDDVWMFDTNNTLTLSNARSPRWGYENPWQNHVLFVTTQQPPSFVNFEVMSDSAVAVFRPNHPRINVTVSTRILGDPGGTAEFQAVYQVDGGAPVTIPASVGSTTSHADVLTTWTYLWPADYWDNVLTLRFQTRMQPGGTGFHRAAHGPVRLYGAPA